MYRSRQERLHLKAIARLHSANNNWRKCNRSKLGIGYEDMTAEEREKTRYKCDCERCVMGKQHKHLRKELATPFEGSNEDTDYRDLKNINTFYASPWWEIIDREEEEYWYYTYVHTNFEEWTYLGIS